MKAFKNDDQIYSDCVIEGYLSGNFNDDVEALNRLNLSPQMLEDWAQGGPLYAKADKRIRKILGRKFYAGLEDSAPGTLLAAVVYLLTGGKNNLNKLAIKKLDKINKKTTKPLNAKTSLEDAEQITIAALKNAGLITGPYKNPHSGYPCNKPSKKMHRLLVSLGWIYSHDNEEQRGYELRIDGRAYFCCGVLKDEKAATLTFDVSGY